MDINHISIYCYQSFKFSKRKILILTDDGLGPINLDF